MYHPRLKGSHYDMGYKYGDILYKGGISFESVINLSEEQLQFGVESIEICKDVYPEILEEIKGFTDGLRYSFEKFACFLISAGVFDYNYGCTCFCMKNENEVIFARNHDMFTELRKNTESVLCQPENGYTFLGQGDALIGKEEGINEHGLAVGFTYVRPKQHKPGLSFLFIIRYLIEKCANVEEALREFNKIPVASSQNILLVDKSGDMAVIESCSEKYIVRRPENNENFLAISNNFTHPDMLEYDGSPELNWYHSQTRYETAVNALKTGEKDYSLDYAKKILSGELGFICQYERKLKFDTLWSSLARLNDLKIYRAEGNPRKTKFSKETRLDWAMNRK